MADPTEFSAALVGRIRSARKAAGLTQQAAADVLGMHVNQYQRHEAGKHVMSAFDLVRIAIAIGIAPGSLIGGELSEIAARNAAEAGWNACRRQVYALAEDYINRTHDAKNTVTAAGNFYRGQYDVAKSFAKTFNSFEALDCDRFNEIDFSTLSGGSDHGA